MLDEGVRVGRYTIVRLLGRGGMGAVYEADDPELARRVAIKILHEDRNPDERAALRREAQALATLVHQNVVMVYDVGVDEEGDVFLVMQLVEGETIDDWIARTKPPTATIIAKFRQAGAGLAAAHAAGLVHCDFKPANVLVDDKGAVRVGDFGLAHRSARITGRSVESMPTLMTTLAGTPAYMAPEQFEGLVTPATDQFAFCVALWECLAGERPFMDVSHPSLDPASRGPRRELPPGKKIPRYARRVIDRGMADTPATRFPSMTALVEALQPRRGLVALIAAAAIAAIASGVIVYFATRTEPGLQGTDLEERELLTNMGTEGCAYAPMIDPGGSVVFDRTRGEVVDLYSVPLAGGPLQQLTSSPNWEWRAQRGRKPGEISYLVHDRTDETASQVRYRDLTTGDETVAVKSSVVWDAVTVDGQIIYSPNANKGLWVVKDGEDKTFAMPDKKGYSYFGVTASNAGDQLAITLLEPNAGNSGAPCTMDFATKHVRCFDKLLTPVRPAFGRDGNVLYVAEIDGIYRVDLITGEAIRLTKDYAEGGLAVAPDGSALVFSSCYARTNIIDAATGETIINDIDGNQPAVGPNGAMTWVRTIRNRQVLMYRSPSGEIRQLTTVEQGSVANPRFSPDGKYLVFAMTPPRGGLHIIPLDKPGGIRQVTNDAGDYYPHWAGDHLIAFMQSDNAAGERVFVVGIDGNDRREVLGANRSLYGAKGKQLLVGGYSEAYWLDPATGTELPGPKRTEIEPESGTTSPSGNWVVYQLGADGHTLYRARTDGSPLELVRRFDSSYFVNKPTITDQGQVIVSAGPMYGDLVKITAKPGSFF